MFFFVLVCICSMASYLWHTWHKQSCGLQSDKSRRYSITESDDRGMREVCRVAGDRKWNWEVELETGVPSVEALSQRDWTARIHASAAPFSFFLRHGCKNNHETRREEREKPEDNQNREEIPQDQDETKTSTLKTQTWESTRQLRFRQNLGPS